MTKKTFSCNPVSALIFESQCATKHAVEIVDEVGDDGVTRIKIGLKATDTSGAFSSGWGKGGSGHAVKYTVRFTPTAEDGGASRNLVTNEKLAFVPGDDGYAWTVFDANTPGTYNTTVTSQSGDECCTPKGSVTHTTKVLAPEPEPETTTTTNNQIISSGGGTPVATGPSPIMIAILATTAVVAIGWSLMDSDEGGE